MIYAQTRREFKEYGVYAAVGSVALAALVAGLLYSGQTARMGIVADTFVTTTLVAFALFGVALGAASTLADRRRGHWGFLVHRPAPRGAIFAGKLLGLLGLYAVAMLLPLATAIGCGLDTRLTHAPFAWLMLTPLLLVMAGGLLWTIVGVLIAARQARWVGSRLFPVAAGALAFALAATTVETLPTALLILFAGMAVLAVAALAFFVSNGAFGPQPLWAKPVSALCVLTGAGFVLLFVVGGGGEALLAAAGRVGYEYLDFSFFYTIGPDGQPYRQSSTIGRTVEVTATADGRPLSAADKAWYSFHGVTSTLLYMPGPDGHEPNSTGLTYAMTYLRPVNTASRSSTDPNWFYVRPRGLLEALTPDGRPLGVIGTDGFHATGPARPFPPDTEPGNRSAELITMTSRHDVYVVSPRAREVRAVYHTDDADDPVYAAELLTMPLPADRSIDFGTAPLAEVGPYVRVAVVTRHSTRVVPLDGSPAAVLPSDPPVKWANRTVAAWGVGNAATLTEGDVLTSLRDGRLGRLELTPPEHRMAVEGRPPPRWLRDTSVWVAPPAAVGFKYALTGWQRHRWPDATDWLILLVPAVVAIGLTLLAVRGADRRGRWAWVISAALLGPAIALTALVLRERAGRVTCPACGKRRPVDADLCPHCGRAFPDPGDAATAVFEPAAAAA